MLAMNLVDSADTATNYGILLCNNDEVTEDVLQYKVDEIRNQLDTTGEEWSIDDVMWFLPKEWDVTLQKEYRRIEI